MSCSFSNSFSERFHAISSVNVKQFTGNRRQIKSEPIFIRSGLGRPKQGEFTARRMSALWGKKRRIQNIPAEIIESPSVGTVFVCFVLCVSDECLSCQFGFVVTYGANLN